jgi:hypothetical protein
VIFEPLGQGLWPKISSASLEFLYR